MNRTPRTRSLRAAAALALAAGTTAAADPTEITSVQPGAWDRSSTWDLRVPEEPDDIALLKHDVNIDDDSVEILAAMVGVGVDATLTLVPDADDDLEIFEALKIGVDGGTGTVFVGECNELEAGTIIVGYTGPGILIADEDTDDITATAIADPGDFSFRIGADGYPGTFLLDFDNDIASDGGLSLGPQGTLAFVGELETDDSSTIAVNGNLAFAPGSVIDLLESAPETPSGDPAAPGDTLSLIEFTGERTGLPEFTPPVGFDAELNTDTPGQLRFVITEGLGDFVWDKAGNGNFYIGQNWQSDAAPFNGGNILINNSGNAIADGLNPLNTTTFAVNNLTIGDRAGSGGALVRFFDRAVIGAASDDLRIAHAPLTEDTPAGDFDIAGQLHANNNESFRVSDDAIVALAGIENAGTGTATASLNIEHTRRVEFRDDLAIATARADAFDPDLGALGRTPNADVTANAHATVNLSDIDTLTIDDELLLASASASRDPCPGASIPAAHAQATLHAENIGTLTVGNDLGLAPLPRPFFMTSASATAHATFRNIGLVTISDTLELLAQAGGDPTPGQTGHIDAVAVATFENTRLVVEQRSIDIAEEVFIRGDELTNVSATVNLIDTIANVNDGVVVGSINADLDRSAQPALVGNVVEAALHLDGAAMCIDDHLEIGERRDGAPPNTLTATTTLDNGSLIRADSGVELGTDGEIVFHIDGPLRADPFDEDADPAARPTNRYAAIDVPRGEGRNGNTIASDDNDGVGLFPAISLGSGSGELIGDPSDLGGDGISNGEDGPLPQGVTITVVLGSADSNLDTAESFFDADPGTGGPLNPALNVFVESQRLFLRRVPFGAGEFGLNPIAASDFAGEPWADFFLNAIDTEPDDYTMALFEGDVRPPSTNVTLNGAITVKFDTTLPPGAYDFDLIVTDGLIAGDPTLTTEGLPADFDIDFFGVLQDTDLETAPGDILRLSISSDVCPGDANGDDRVGLIDLFIVLANYGRPSNAGPIGGDVNNSGFVSADDLFFVLANFGKLCV